MHLDSCELHICPILRCSFPCRVNLLSALGLQGSIMHLLFGKIRQFNLRTGLICGRSMEQLDGCFEHQVETSSC